MSKFYGTLQGDNGAVITRRGHNETTVVAASWEGAIHVAAYSGENGKPCVRVERRPWRGSGGLVVVLYHGTMDVSAPYSTDLK